MQLNIDTADLKTIDEASDLLQKHKNTIYNWIKEERLCSIVIGGKQFIPLTEIDRILKADTPLTQAMVNDEV